MIKSILTLGLALTLGVSASFAKGNNAAEKQNEKQTSELRHPEWGDNIIRISPITALDLGVGPNISYERIFSADKKMSFILPFSFMMQNGYGSYSNSSRLENYFYFSPGLKFYPFGQRKVTYAIGPNLFVGAGGGRSYDSYYDYNTGNYYENEVQKNIFRFGILVNNYCNFQITDRFNLGVTLGLGIVYFDREKKKDLMTHDVQISNDPMDVTGQFSFTVGYRF